MTANRERYNADDYVTVPRSHLAKLEGEIERLRKCIEDVREDARAARNWRSGDDIAVQFRDGVRSQGGCTMEILKRHAADGGGDA